MKFHYQGLNPNEIEKSRQINGKNELPPPEIESFWEKLQGNFDDPLIRILCVALAITMFLAFLGYAEWFEGVGIAVAVVLATFVATYSEFKNEASFQQLQLEASKVKNKVFRGGHIVDVLVNDIVVGDYVLLQPGDKVPADGRLIVGEVGAVQAVLTGEPDAVRKLSHKDAGNATSSSSSDDEGFSDPYKLFRGAVIDDGEGVLIVEKVGLQTFYGRLFDELNTDDERESPLQHKLSNLADGISMIGYVGATFIAVSFLFKQFVMDNNYSWVQMIAYISNWQLALKDVVTSLILAIIIIVVAVPEGLPMMIAIVLSLNMRKLLKSNVLVRKLLGIETAGSLNTLFLDKTGTITRGRFDPQLFLSPDGTQYSKFKDMPMALQKTLALALKESTSAQIDTDASLAGGNASDRALLRFLSKEALLEESRGVTPVREILFSSARKFSAAQVELSKSASSILPNDSKFKTDHETVTLIKGAPEILLNASKFFVTPDGKLAVLDTKAVDNDIDTLSRKGLRLVAIGISGDPLPPSPAQTLPKNVVLLGCIAILDETRPESNQTVQQCRSAGIQVVMITGDRQETADAVARDINLKNASQTRSITSNELNRMSDDDIKKILPSLAVVSRALPTDKSRLVRLSQEMGRVVGMTGDGVNDSAALKKADVGFAMGSGSEVAKEAADIVILDDNFKSIAMAVLYGRTIFRSIRKFVVFQSTVNLSSSAIVFLGPFLGFDFPLTLIQLLWVNLVMDTFAALAFGGEPALDRYMKVQPIPRTAPIISGDMWSSIIFNGLYIAFACVMFLIYDPVRYFYRADEEVFLTAFFCLFIFLTTFNSFNVRTSRLNLMSNLFKNKGFLGIQLLIFVVQISFTVIGGQILRTVALTPNEWSTTIALSASIIPFDLLRKVVHLPFTNAHKEKDD